MERADASSPPWSASMRRCSRASRPGWGGGFLGLAARFVFAAVLAGYYWNSARTKIGEGIFGLFDFTDAAYMQILPAQMEAAGYDASAIPWFPWSWIVALGTWAEFVLPALIILGPVHAAAALGMIGFVLVQSWVDIAFHGVDAATIGALFDRVSGSAIMDQRTLWVFVLAVLVIRGRGLAVARPAARPAVARGRSPRPAEHRRSAPRPDPARSAPRPGPAGPGAGGRRATAGRPTSGRACHSTMATARTSPDSTAAARTVPDPRHPQPQPDREQPHEQRHPPPPGATARSPSPRPACERPATAH
ncbi:MAG: hypothetical protein KatS3mg118_2988 [Paracoccaceae bacterium]|nr:MAG: hypothetical protein KatS3mg118_2988 [Paracoccaceae bacterium]